MLRLFISVSGFCVATKGMYMYDLETFYGPNAGYVLELYERYKQDPASVDEATRAIFASWPPELLLPLESNVAPQEPVGARMDVAPGRDGSSVQMSLAVAASALA